MTPLQHLEVVKNVVVRGDGWVRFNDASITPLYGFMHRPIWYGDNVMYALNASMDSHILFTIATLEGI